MVAPTFMMLSCFLPKWNSKAMRAGVSSAITSQIENFDKIFPPEHRPLLLKPLDIFHNAHSSYFCQSYENIFLALHQENLVAFLRKAPTPQHRDNPILPPPLPKTAAVTQPLAVYQNYHICVHICCFCSFMFMKFTSEFMVSVVSAQ